MTNPTQLNEAEQIVLRQVWQYQGGPVLSQREWERLGGSRCFASLDVNGHAIRESLVRKGLLRRGSTPPYSITDDGIARARAIFSAVHEVQMP